MIRAASTRYALTLFSLFGVYWVALAIAPLHRNDWLLENVLGPVHTTKMAPAVCIFSSSSVSRCAV